nr:hypothetical protein [Tanacetum cinerariifolium]
DDVAVLMDEKEEENKVEEAKIDESAQVPGRKAESQEKIYKINMDHASKVLSIKEDELDSYKAPLEETGKGPVSKSSEKKKGRTVVITTEDMHKRKNDVKARTTLLLALPDEHQLRFSNSSSNTSSGKGEVPTASVSTASIQVSTASTDVAAASLSHD